MNIDMLFQEASNRGASDIHIKEGEPIVLRIQGKLERIYKNIRPDKVMMFDFLYNLLYYKQRDRIAVFKRELELDFGYISSDGSSYRGNVYMHTGKISIALRKVPERIQNLIELGMPTSIKRALKAKQGLFLITGPTGSGKSTTMASMLEAINEVRSERVLTIEDPIEYIFQDKKSIFTQREVGRDTLSYARAIRSAMREDANIIVVGEIRDSETMESVLSLAETGHVVFSTMHTAGSIQTINRVVQFFPLEMEMSVRARLSESLIGAFAQRLIPRKDGAGRIAIREIMYVNTAVKNIIAKGNLSHLMGVIQTGGEDGMITMHDYADKLADEGLIEPKDYMGYFVNEFRSDRDEDTK